MNDCVCVCVQVCVIHPVALSEAPDQVFSRTLRSDSKPPSQWTYCLVSIFTHNALRSHLDVVVLTQVGRLQVEVAEVEFDVEAARDADVPAALRLPRIRLGEVWRPQDAVRVRQGRRLGVDQWRGGGEEEEEEEVTVGG